MADIDTCVILNTPGLCMKCLRPATIRHACVEGNYSRLFCERCCPECGEKGKPDAA